MPSDPLRRSAALLLLAALLCATGVAAASSSPHDALPMAAVLATLAGLLGGLARLRPRLGAEGARKALHVSMGVALAGLPWLFDRSAPVVALAGVATLLLAAVRLVPLLRRGVGGVLHDVARVSWGDLVYPAGVALAFALAGSDRLAYVAALGALALADPAAAVAGMNRAGARQAGRRWRVPGGRRSAAGTLACAAVAGTAAALAALALGRSLPEALVFALPVAVAAAATEAATGGGLDNLTVPVAVVLVAAASPALAWTGAVLLAAVALVAAWLGERTRNAASPLRPTATPPRVRSGGTARVRPALP